MKSPDFNLRWKPASLRAVAMCCWLILPNPWPAQALQTVNTNPPPLSPSVFNPDPGVPPIRTNAPAPEVGQLRVQVHIDTNAPAQPPSAFNPDPGAMLEAPQPEAPPFFHEATNPTLQFGSEPVPPELQLPRLDLRLPHLEETFPAPPGNYGFYPLSDALKLPRRRTRSNEPVDHEWKNIDYPLAARGLGYPSNSVPETNRWLVGFSPWRRYATGDAETAYQHPAPALWHPYQQSVLKGDLPIIGQDIFLNMTASSETVVEARSLPTPSGISSAVAGNADFFGQSDQVLVQNYLSLSFDLFKGLTVFQPPQWVFHWQPVYNVNYIETHDTGVVEPSPAAGTGRTREYFSPLQEAYAEYHVANLSPDYDFLAVRVGDQPFNSDFRGFIFNDVNSGLRAFGNLDDNRLQYNAVIFDMREKDTDSELNTPDERDQRVLILNAYRQDFLFPGYTTEFSLHANWDDGRTHYDRNGFLVRPAPIGTIEEHDISAYYLGWSGDGHIGRWNVNHALYEALGYDTLNGIASQPVEINAQMAALELSYDRDWIRYKASLFYASGDSNPTGHTVTGFDSIVDNPTFIGGPFSWFSRQGFGLAGTSVGLKQRDSLLFDLRTSKTEGQANFDNPGALIYGLGTEIDLTPKLRNFINVNYINFADTASLRTVLQTDKVDPQFGLDLSIGFQYRPFLTQNVIVSLGFGALLPGRGYRDIYRQDTSPIPGFEPTGNAGGTDDFLYSALFAITLTY